MGQAGAVYAGQFGDLRCSDAKRGRLLIKDWDKYNGATVVFEPKQMTVEQLRRAQMAAFCDFYRPRSAFARLKIWPIKKHSWLANIAIYRGLVYYYRSHKKQWTLPSFMRSAGMVYPSF